MLSGDDDETSIRTFSDPHRPIFQRGSIDGFILAVPRCLGRLNYLRLWHDNSGRGSSASWFVKSLVVRDLQTSIKSHFICQRWLAVEEDDGLVSLSLFSALCLSLSTVDRARATSGERGREERVQLCAVETSVSECVGWPFVVFDLLSSYVESIHSSTTVHLLFRAAVHIDVVQHSVL